MRPYHLFLLWHLPPTAWSCCQCGWSLWLFSECGAECAALQKCIPTALHSEVKAGRDSCVLNSTSGRCG